MTTNAPARPVTDRVAALDVVRGLALFGVLIVNVVTEFRVSLFDWLVNFHVGPGGPVSDGVDVVLASLVEMKAFGVFSMLFGVGLAIQGERRRDDPMFGTTFRRLLGLFILGVAHYVLVWHGDILAAYAVIGALLTALLRLDDARLLVAALLLLGLGALPFPTTAPFPGADHIASSRAVYGHGTWADALRFRLDEVRFFLPLHLSVAPRTLGFMAFGAWTWRVGVWQGRHRGWLVGVAAVGLPVGVAAGVWGVWHALRGAPPSSYVEALSIVSSTLGYAAVAYLAAGGLRWLAPLGRMALTNYLTQSLVWSFVFYGWGLGLYYRLDAVTTLGLGVGLYVLQINLSAAWLRQFRYGPVEWAWRCASYAQLLPLRVSHTTA